MSHTITTTGPMSYAASVPRDTLTEMNRSYLTGAAVLVLVSLVVGAILTQGDGADPQAAADEQRMRVAIESGLKNAATAAETYATDNNGSYEFADEMDLGVMGLQLPENVTFAGLEMAESHYCIVLEHQQLPKEHPWRLASYSSDIGVPTPDDQCSR